MKTFGRPFLYFGVLCLAWGSTIAVGMHMLADNTASAHASNVPFHFPADAALMLADDQPTLIVLVPAQRAEAQQTLAELGRAMAELHGKVKAYAVISRALDAAADSAAQVWTHTATIPGVTPVGDEDGRETRRFGGQALGQTLVYSQAGHLLYAGEIANASKIDARISPLVGCSSIGRRIAAAQLTSN